MNEVENITEFITSLNPADILLRLFSIQKELGASVDKLNFPRFNDGVKETSPEIGYVFFGEENSTEWCVQVVVDACFGRCTVFISAIGLDEPTLKESIIKGDFIAERLKET